MASEYQPPLSAQPPTQKSSKVPWILGGCALLLLIVFLLGVAGYGLYRWKAATKNVNANRQSPVGGTEDTHPPDGSSSPAQANSNSNSAAAPTPEGKPTSWETKASSLTGADGSTFTLVCTPSGTSHAVWGSDIYTAD